MISLRPKLTGLFIALMIASLLFSACGPYLAIDFDYHGRDNESGIGPVSENGVFSIIVMLLLGLFGLVLALGRSRKYR